MGLNCSLEYCLPEFLPSYWLMAASSALLLWALECFKLGPFPYVWPKVHPLMNLSSPAKFLTRSALPWQSSQLESRQFYQGDFLEVLCPYSVSGYWKRPITELSTSAMLRLQVFSTSWRLNSSNNRSALFHAVFTYWVPFLAILLE
jgi:hypothetical protein